mmetsp:Transcript_18413/g.44956  ORF Transcript_18413/g.44956 Transcript_18413/m.44956 type:complete len:750 (-) Transcript_18413:45-2294(-)
MRVSCFVAAAAASQVNPVQKVISLLGKLQSQLEDEGKAEAASYDKYACFCKEQADDKVYSTGKSSEKIADLKATKEDLVAKINKLNGRVNIANGESEDVEGTMNDEKATRDSTSKAYQTADNEKRQAIEAISKAIDALKASMKKQKNVNHLDANLLATVSTAILGAPEFVVTGDERDALESLLQAPAGKPAATKSHLGDIVTLLVKLRQVFKEKKASADAEETESRQTFEMAQQKRGHLAKSLRDNIDTMKVTVASLSEQKASVVADLAEEQAKYNVEKKFLDDLTVQCENKATAWDQRSEMRTKELQAIAQALEILKSKVSENYGANKKLALVQQEPAEEGDEDVDTAEGEAAAAEDTPTPAAPAAPAAPEDDAAPPAEEAPAAADADEEGAEDPPADEDDHADQSEGNDEDSLLQVDAPAGKTAEFLMRKARLLDSPVLTALALQVRADPFKKVRNLINDLIDKLEAQAVAEKESTDFCSEQMEAESTKRDNAKKTIEDKKAKIAKTTAKKESLKQEIKDLEKEIAELQQQAVEAEQLRAQEKSQNDVTVAEAEAGLQGIRDALRILREVYKSEALVQVKKQGGKEPVEGTPEEYESESTQGQGNQVLNFLEVIKADFERTIQSVGDAESKAQSDYDADKLSRDTNIQDDKKEIVKKDSELGTAKTNLFDLNSDLADEKDKLKLAQEALETLKPSCVDTSMSYKERKERREQDINALKDALKVLEESTANVNVGALKQVDFLQKKGH